MVGVDFNLPSTSNRVRTCMCYMHVLWATRVADVVVNKLYVNVSRITMSRYCFNIAVRPLLNRALVFGIENKRFQIFVLPPAYGHTVFFLASQAFQHRIKVISNGPFQIQVI